MSRFFSTSYSKAIAVTMLVALVVGIPLVAISVKNQQQLQQLAWSVSQSANSICSSSGSAIIHVSFTNTESSGSSNAMKVTVTDQQTHKIVDLGTIQPGQTQIGDIDTGNSTISSGTVIFYLSWANGRSGTDQRTANYSAITCHAPTATNTPTPQNTNTPTPRPTNTLTPTFTPTPTPTPTPTVTPQITETPTPSVCVTPGQVSNVRIVCPNCTQ